MKSKSKSLSASIVEKLLIVSVLLLIVVLIAIIGIMNGFLAEKAREADHAQIDAKISDTDLENMKRAGIKLDKEKDVVERTKKIVAESKFYQYQNEIVNDFQAYAAEAGLKITGFAFSQNSGTATTPTSGKTTTAASSTAAATPSVGKGPQPKGVNSVQTIINFDEADYKSMLKFIKRIEQNVTRMQIVDLNLSPKPQAENTLANPTMTIRVYTR